MKARLYWLAVAVFCGSIWTQTVSAQARVGVGSFEGTSASRARTAVVQAIGSDGATVVGDDELNGAAESLHADIATDSGRVAVARQLKLSALVAGVVRSGRGGQLEAQITVYDGATGAQLGEARIAGRAAALTRQIRVEFPSELGGAIAQGRVPEPVASRESDSAAEPAATTEAESTPDVPASTSPDTDAAHGPLPRALEVLVGVRVQGRGLHYNDALTRLGEHSLAPTPAARIEARWYPAAHFTDGFIANLGLDVHAQFMWPVDAKLGALAFRTTSVAFGAGLRLRLPLGEPDKSEIGALIGYGVRDFSLDAASGGQQSGVPGITFGFVRIGADGRFLLDDTFSLNLRAAYLLLTGYGQIATPQWYPHTSGGGIEAELTLGIAISKMVTIRAGAGLVRYFLSLNPNPMDPGVVLNHRIAGGATDQELYGTAALVLYF